MQAPNQTSQLNPNSIINDLNSQDPKAKVNAVKNLSILCNAIGQERVKKELIPYLTSNQLFNFPF